MSLRAALLALDAAAPSRIDPLALRRAALWSLFAAKLIAGWGVQWDIQWHVRIGRDSFWIAPHIMTYTGVTLVVMLSWGVLAWETLRGRGAVAGTGEAAPTVRALGLSGTRGFHLAAWGIALTVLAAPIDDLWHRLFGLDVTLWSPPHLMGIVGAAINTVACLVIAREVYPAGGARRLLAMVIAGALLYGTLHLTVDPSIRIAYVHGGVRFYTYAILAALVLPLALTTTARLSGYRAAPLLLLLFLLPVGLAGDGIARAGFAWLQPVSVMDEEIAKDPTSPIAVAAEIARRNGTVAGRPGGILRLFGLIPLAVMVAVDARRRPMAATVGYAATLSAVSGWVMSTWPAFRPVVPGAPETVLALLLTVAAALIGATASLRLCRALIEGRSTIADAATESETR